MSIRCTQFTCHIHLTFAQYPIQKKDHTYEFLRTMPHLRGRTEVFAALNRIRSSAASIFRNYLTSNGFLEIFAPALMFTDCEGSGECFEVKGGKEVFGSPTFLSGSGQLYGELAATSHSKVFCFGPTFRAEKHNTTRHLSEFWMLEPEISFLNSVDELMDVIEGMLTECTQRLMGENGEDLRAVISRIENIPVVTRRDQMAKGGFARLTYSQAIERLAKHDHEFKSPAKWETGLQLEHEKFLTDNVYKSPVFVTDYPAHLKPFYMKANEDGRTVACLDLLVPGLAEIVGGSLREDRHDRLLERMQERKMDPSNYSWYLDLRKYGGAPHGGFGLGFDRYLQFMTGLGNIRDVSMIPRSLGNNAL